MFPCQVSHFLRVLLSTRLCVRYTLLFPKCMLQLFRMEIAKSILKTIKNCLIKRYFRDLQDGGRVRRRDHLPPRKHFRNTSTCGTPPTEHLLNAGSRPQTSQKARNSPRTWVGTDLHQREGAVREEKFPHTRKPRRVAGGKLQSHGGERSNRGAESKAERFPHRGSAPSSTHQPERLVCSPAGAGGAGS